MERRAVLLSAPAILASARAREGFPNRPVRVVISFAAGGPTDVVMRKVAERLSPLLGQPIVVDNRTGASGTIGSAEVARARPDGYTPLVAVSSSHAIAATVMARPGFHPASGPPTTTSSRASAASHR